ncbi:hypothetical protein GCM10025864_09010 [Luteimicrobium album]|uniref:DNA-directed DNA polymerase n=1 Tax=Luteimicrobium album TaxID=1054550 RepID=A0ABQ6HXL6_9MICO|nr:DNA polymerase III subunit gamma and tau [Luteimicrobium album]GMA23142.1 hypothetical protein GCM10025864_09010 [Luteimicrobium album]
MSTALYRRYRPETFAEVIGQEHVTGPLMQALRTGRVNHAYLFSGPRGCGKTTSARILARTLNCHQNTPEHPIDTPCGECPSCVDLARGGSGSLDVVEIDAASHGGVEDARELRERATFAPSRDRYKVFIIDEAHMVSSAGFNALLKIVEEPPEHVRFIFATTEPDKVIGTIRSRTHHYPFRLVPPDVLVPYLDELCRAEGVEVGSGVLPLVVRAGGGSVRDTLSVLDQLIAGADEAPGTGESGERRRVLDYEQAVALLGYTHATLLDDVVGALAARDGASMFRVVERVIESGHEPRRFVEDLLERLRDLIVLAVADGEAVAALGDLPTDQLDRMRSQSAALGLGELSRAADLANSGLTEMTGATSPRLHLELLCARLLLPGADDGAAGFGARLDRLERGWVGGGGGSVAAPLADVPSPRAVRPVDVPARAERPTAVAPVAPPATPEPAPVPASGPADGEPGAAASAPAGAPEGRESAPPEPGRPEGEPADMDDAQDAPAEPDRPAPEAVPAPAAPAAPPAAPAVPVGGAGVAQVESELIRRRWDEVLATLARSSRSAWSLVAPNATVASLEGNVLTLSFGSPGLQRALQSGKSEAVEKAVYETLGFPVKVSAIVGGAPAPVARPRAEHRQSTPDDDSGSDTPGDRGEVPRGPATESPGVVGDAAAADQRAASAPTPSPARSDAVSAADAAWLAGTPRPASSVPDTPVPSSGADDGDAEPPGASDAVGADLSSADTSNADERAEAVPVESVPRGETPGPEGAAEDDVADASPADAPPATSSTVRSETDGAAEDATREAPRAAAPARTDADARPVPADPAFYDGIPVAEPPDDGPFPDDGGSWAPRGAPAAGGRPPHGRPRPRPRPRLPQRRPLPP